MDTLEVLKNLTDTQKSQYVEFENLFRTKGWKLFVEEFESKAEQSRVAVIEAPDWDSNRLAYGYGTAVTEVAKFEENLMAEFERLAILNQEADYSTDDESTIDEPDFE